MASLRLKEASRAQFQRAQRLHRREQRSRHRQMLVEGPQAVRELLACAPHLARDLYVTEAALRTHGDIATLAGQTQVWTHPLDERDMDDLSGDSQGLVAVADMPEALDARQLCSGARLVIATLDISDPGNLGTIVRTADACGADAVLLGKGSAELYSPKVIRSAAGSHFHVPCGYGLTIDEIVGAARGSGMQVLAADGAGQWDLPVLASAASEAALLGTRPAGPDLTRPVLWLFGNEARGFSEYDVTRLAEVVSIPLYGKAESLNVAAAVSVCAYVTAMAQAAGSGA
ncbi:MAG: RNA methyltransferase [Actinomycetaceae bacterium]|nr:RNA methyltransferase [Actinomycetaceae bacterium]